jgi:hypothetical protein
MTQKRGAPVDHSTLNHWVIKYTLCRVMAAGAKAQEVSHVLMRMAEAGRGREPFELQQRTYALFDGGMALFQEIIRVARRLMADRQCKL